MKRVLGFVLALAVVLSGCASNELEEERAMEPNSEHGAEADLTPLPPSEGDTYSAPAAAQPTEEAITEAKPAKKHGKKHKKDKKNKKVSKKAKKKKRTAEPPSDVQ